MNDVDQGKNNDVKQFLLNFNYIFFSIFIIVTPLLAENIIQREKLSFETCVDVIGKSSEKLSVVPDIVVDKNDFRQANFQMSDGILSITCDKQKNEIIVKIH